MRSSDADSASRLESSWRRYALSTLVALAFEKLKPAVQTTAEAVIGEDAQDL